MLRKIFLFPFAVVYDVITRIRNFFYAAGILKRKTFSVPVIVIGNLSVGGTGKTPHAEYLVELLSNRYKIAYLSRGYRRKTKGFLLLNDSHTATDTGDEALQVFRKHRDLIVAVDESRTHGIETLKKCFPDLELIILDDAFQHRAVKPALSLLLTEFHKPWFRDFILPAGNLRESRSFAKEADVIIVTKCPLIITSGQKEYFLSKLKPLPHQVVLFSSLQYGQLLPFSKEKKPVHWENLKNKTVVLFSGIGNSQPLADFVRRNCARMEEHFFGDHHYFTEEEITAITGNFDTIAGENKIILTTEKDFVRLDPVVIKKYFSGKNAFYITIKIHFNQNDQKNLEQIILKHVAKN